MTDTHYVPAFAARAICGAIGPHSDRPTCADCNALLMSEALRAAGNLWNAVPLPPDTAAALDQPYATSPCLDSSTANCVASEFDAARCRSCRREFK